MICFSKIWLCATSHNCIFWVLDNFYCHKNFIGSYYTLYTIFYNSFYVPNIIKIPVLIGFYSLWLKLKKTGCSPGFFIFLNYATGCGCPLPIFGSKNQTGLDLWTLISPEVISAIRATAYLFCDKPDQECCVLSRCWWWRTKKNLFLFWERKNGLICSEPLWARSRKSGSALAQVWLGSLAHLLGAELVATLYQPNRYTNSVFFIGSSGLLSSHC